MTQAEIAIATAEECIDRIEVINEFLAGEGGTPQRVSADRARRERELLAERIEQIENDDRPHHAYSVDSQ